VSSNVLTPEADVVTPKSEGFSRSRPVDSPARIVNILALVCLAVFSVAYFIWTVRESQRGPLDTDEVFVIWIERYFTLGRITDALKLGLDTQPPAYYWMLKGFCRIFGTGALAIRLPSLIAFYAFVSRPFWWFGRGLASSWQCLRCSSARSPAIQPSWCEGVPTPS
jgi:4-amino-4-deoxy-L-arabinose transferase-like glycosyltransferase